MIKFTSQAQKSLLFAMACFAWTNYGVERWSPNVHQKTLGLCFLLFLCDFPWFQMEKHLLTHPLKHAYLQLLSL